MVIQAKILAQRGLNPKQFLLKMLEIISGPAVLSQKLTKISQILKRFVQNRGIYRDNIYPTELISVSNGDLQEKAKMP